MNGGNSISHTGCLTPLADSKGLNKWPRGAASNPPITMPKNERVTRIAPWRKPKAPSAAKSRTAKSQIVMRTIKCFLEKKHAENEPRKED